jgi:hypothetical protein
MHRNFPTAGRSDRRSTDLRAPVYLRSSAPHLDVDVRFLSGQRFLHFQVLPPERALGPGKMRPPFASAAQYAFLIGRHGCCRDRADLSMLKA